MYRGETEASNNFYRAYILNVKFGEDFDYAFANSMEFLPYLTPRIIYTDVILTAMSLRRSTSQRHEIHD